jgi:hypothetical protein
MNDSQHDVSISVIMLNVSFFNFYAVCHYAEGKSAAGLMLSVSLFNYLAVGIMLRVLCEK